MFLCVALHLLMRYVCFKLLIDFVRKLIIAYERMILICLSLLLTTNISESKLHFEVLIQRLAWFMWSLTLINTLVNYYVWLLSIVLAPSWCCALFCLIFSCTHCCGSCTVVMCHSSFGVYVQYCWDCYIICRTNIMARWIMKMQIKKKQNNAATWLFAGQCFIIHISHTRFKAHSIRYLQLISCQYISTYVFRFF